MYTTKGVDAVATITEVRANTSELIEHARKNKSAVLIQKNNDPYAVLLDWNTYQELMGLTGTNKKSSKTKNKSSRKGAA